MSNMYKELMVTTFHHCVILQYCSGLFDYDNNVHVQRIVKSHLHLPLSVTYKLVKIQSSRN